MLDLGKKHSHVKHVSLIWILLPSHPPTNHCLTSLSHVKLIEASEIAVWRGFAPPSCSSRCLEISLDTRDWSLFYHNRTRVKVMQWIGICDDTFQVFLVQVRSDRARLGLHWVRRIGRKRLAAGKQRKEHAKRGLRACACLCSSQAFSFSTYDDPWHWEKHIVCQMLCTSSLSHLGQPVSILLSFGSHLHVKMDQHNTRRTPSLHGRIRTIYVRIVWKERSSESHFQIEAKAMYSDWAVFGRKTDLFLIPFNS